MKQKKQTAKEPEKKAVAPESEAAVEKKDEEDEYVPYVSEFDGDDDDGE